MSKSDVFSKELKLFQDRPWAKLLTLMPALMGAALAVWVRDNGVGVMVASTFAFYAAVFAFRYRPRPKLAKVTVEASREGISIDGKLLPRAQIREGVVLPKRQQVPLHVRLTQRGMRRRVELAVSSVDAGRELLRALGFDASQSVATFSTMSRAVASPQGFVAGTLGAVAGLVALAFVTRPFGIAVPVSLFGAVFIAIAMAAVGVIQTKLDVGADGLGARWLWWRRFYRWSDVASFARYQTSGAQRGAMGIELTLRSGKVVRFPIGSVSWESDALSMIEERIREAVDIHERGGAEDGSSALGRGDRSTAAWIAYLRSLGTGGNVGPRTAPVDQDKLFRIVEDPKAGGTARAAAAIALGAEIDEDGRARLRIAAQATAAPTLRVALEAAAKDDEAAMSEALAALESEEGLAARRA